MPEQQVIREHYYISLPSGLKSGEYRIRVGLFALANRAVLPVLDAKTIDNLGRVILGNIKID